MLVHVPYMFYNSEPMFFFFGGRRERLEFEGPYRPLCNGVWDGCPDFAFQHENLTDKRRGSWANKTDFADERRVQRTTQPVIRARVGGASWSMLLARLTYLEVIARLLVALGRIQYLSCWKILVLLQFLYRCVLYSGFFCPVVRGLFIVLSDPRTVPETLTTFEIRNFQEHSNQALVFSMSVEERVFPKQRRRGEEKRLTQGVR